MRPRLFQLIIASASLLAAASPAHSVICYVVYNRSEAVIYQNTYPPVDMSSAGAPARDAMRARGEHMTFGDISECPTLAFLADSADSAQLQLDAVLGGLPTSGGIKGIGVTGKAPSSGTAPSPGATSAPTPASKPTKSGY